MDLTHKGGDVISTHSLLAEGDDTPGDMTIELSTFQPTPSSRRETFVAVILDGFKGFQPTPSSRRETEHVRA